VTAPAAGGGASTPIDSSTLAKAATMNGLRMKTPSHRRVPKSELTIGVRAHILQRHRESKRLGFESPASNDHAKEPIILPASRTKAAALAVASATAFLLAGCVGTSSDSSADGDVTLTWWGWNNFQYEQVIEQFEEEHPGITVEYKNYAFDDYVTALRPALSSNDGPDVFQLQPGTLVSNFGPLTVDPSEHMATEHGDDWQDLFYPEGLTAMQAEDTQAGLPNYMSAAGLMYYNADVLEELGLEVPADLEQLATTCESITAAGYACLAHGAKDGWVNLDVYLALVNSLAPGLVYEAIEGETAWTDPDLVEAMTAWSGLFSDGVIAEGATAMAEYPDAFSSFVQGEAAFIALGTWNTSQTMTAAGIAEAQKGVSATIDSVFLSAPFPATQAGGTPTAPFGGPDNGWAVSAKSDTQDAALTFLDFLTTGYGQENQASGGNIPAVRDVPVATDDVIDPRQVADIERQQASIADLIGPRQIPYPDLEAALIDALSQVAAGAATPEAALEAVDAVSSSLDRG
jgi:raffinose/stachyose/melibiose transport system substrate-binding protein